MSEDEDVLVGYTLFYGGSFKTRYQHFNSIKTAEMFCSNKSLKDNSKIYVDLDLYQKEKEKNKKQAEHIQGINKRNENLRIHLKLLQAHRLKKYMMDNYISKDKIREKLLEPIRKEADKINKNFFEKDKGFEVEGAVLQELGSIEGMILNLLEED